MRGLAAVVERRDRVKKSGKSDPAMTASEYFSIAALYLSASLLFVTWAKYFRRGTPPSCACSYQHHDQSQVKRPSYAPDDKMARREV